MNNLILKIGGVDVDVSDLDVAITYQVNDLKDIGKRASSFSYTIKLPNSKKVERLFMQIYDLDGDINKTINSSRFNDPVITKFDVKKRTPAELWSNGLLIFDGYLDLIEITQQNKYTEFQIKLVSDGAKWAVDSQLLNLNEINLGEECFNFDFWNNGQLDANATKGKAYATPLIEYGSLIAEYPTLPINIYQDNVYMVFFARELLIKGFEQIGYSINFPLLDSEPLQNLCIPFGNDKIKTTAGFLGDNIYDAVNDVPTFSNISMPSDIPTSATTKFDIGFDTVIEDDGSFAQNQIQGTNLFTSNTNHFCGEVPINISGQFTVSFNGAISQTATSSIRFRIYKDAGATIIYQDDYITQGLGAENAIFDFDFNEFITIGDYISVTIEFISTANVNEITNATATVEHLKVSLHEWRKTNYKFNLQDQLPDCTLFELLRELMTMFNLIVQEDRTSNVLNIYTYNQYFAGVFEAGANPDKRLDWNDKINLNYNKNSISIRTLENGVDFTYQDGDDYFNDQYQTFNDDEVFSSYSLNTNYDISDKRLSVETSKAAPTHNQNLTGLLNEINTAYYAKAEPLELPIIDDTDIGLRFAIYDYKSNVKSYNFVYNNDSAQSVLNDHGYIYFSDLLNFDTNQGLFQTYHDKEMKHLLNGRFVKVVAHISNADVANLNFRKLIFIDNKWFILNKIEQFKPNSNELTKVELLQVYL